MSDFFERRLLGIAQVTEGLIRTVTGKAPSLALPAARRLARKRNARRNAAAAEYLERSAPKVFTVDQVREREGFRHEPPAPDWLKPHLGEEKGC